VGSPHVKVGHRQALITKPSANRLGVFLWKKLKPKFHSSAMLSTALV